LTHMARSRKLPAGVQMKDIFREVARSCATQVKGLPKGERLRAYRQCVKEGIKARVASYEHKL
jgi:hypothetical protein